MTKKDKFKNSKYKNWEQSQLITEYIRMEHSKPNTEIKNVGKLIILTIVSGVIGGIISWVLSMVGVIMEKYPFLWGIIPLISLSIGFIISFSSYQYHKKREQIYYFIKDKKKLRQEMNRDWQRSELIDDMNKANEKEARDRRIQIAEEKESRIRKQQIDDTLNKINDQLDKSSRKESYDVYNKNGEHIGKVDKN